MKNIDWSKVEEAQEFERPTAGGYIMGITKVEDVPEKEYLKLELDIAEGSLKNYYRELFNKKGFWGCKTVKSYKESALPFFKAFITSIEKSNPGYKFNNDERTLVRKFVGVVLGEEEYQANDGTIKTRLYVAEFHSADKIRKGDYKVPPLKTLDSSKVKSKPQASVDMDVDFEEIKDDEDLPF